MKAYMIVTNDELELPVAMDIFGAKAAADYLGIPEQTLRTCLHRIHGAGKHTGIKPWWMKMPR